MSRRPAPRSRNISATLRLAADIGGTFTDIAVFDARTAQLTFGKALSTPHHLVEGITAAVDKAGSHYRSAGLFLHGSTIAINTILERTGARTALIITKGFRDIYEIGRINRPDAYNLFFQKHEPLVERALRFEVKERVLADGEIETPLDERGVAALGQKLDALGVEAVAILFLNCYCNPDHEARAKATIEATYPAMFVSASHELSQEYREFERCSTVVANTYIGPKVRRYLSEIDAHLRDAGFAGSFLVVQSTGGLYEAEQAKVQCIRMLESGPAAGVIGTQALCRTLGVQNAIAFDMGGTTAKAGVIYNGETLTTGAALLGGYERALPVQLAMMDIFEVGTGGGSIARVNERALRVGPQSAGAQPGPACYGRGGVEATVTDANLVLGRISPRGLLDGRVPLDAGAARDAISRLGHELGLSPDETARGVIKVVNANMARALRLVTIQRGVDPNDLALVAFGGAGPLHAAALAGELGIPSIVVPPNPGILCAVGLLVEDLRSDEVRTWLGPLEVNALPTLDKQFLELEARAREWLDRERVGPERRRLSRCLDLRYEGQNYELVVDVPGEVWTEGAVEPLRQAFLRAHEEAYGFSASGEPIQIVNLRLTARGTPDLPRLGSLAAGGRDAQAAVKGSRSVDFDDARGQVECLVYERAHLLAGNEVVGPAVIEQFDRTTLVERGQWSVGDDHGCLMI